jgi:hypothetical protein
MTSATVRRTSVMDAAVVIAETVAGSVELTVRRPEPAR